MNLNDTKIVVAIENAVCDQLEASGIKADPFRLDGEKIVQVIIEQLGGYVVVPKEPTQELLNKMQDFFVGAFENGLTGGQSMHCAYIAMIEAAQEPTPLKVGDLVEPKDYRYILASGACRYPYAYVVNTNPFQLMSEEGDMYWCRTVEVDGYKLLKSNVQLPKGVVDRMIREGLIAPVEAQEQANESE